MSKQRKKTVRVIVIILAVIGVFTVVDNGYRLIKNIGHVVECHRWTLRVID